MPNRAKPGSKCALCLDSSSSDYKMGHLYALNSTTAFHHYCLLFASGLSQSGEDEEGIFGFLERDINKEVSRGKRLHCCYCHKTGATIGCVNSKCRRSYHMCCGLKNSAQFSFSGEFRTLCRSHRSYQKLPQVETDCPICMEGVEFNNMDSILWAPCCRRNDLFHKLCVQRLALSAGYFFKCPLCNDKDLFIRAMQENGIYVPEQDASWELEPNAYEDLLQRPVKCVASICLCPSGRTNTKQDSSWELTFCELCGSQAIHSQCQRLVVCSSRSEWHCVECTSLLADSARRERTLAKARHRAVEGTSADAGPSAQPEDQPKEENECAVPRSDAEDSGSDVEEQCSDAEDPRSDVEEQCSDVEEQRSDVGEPRIDAEEPRIDAEEPRIDAEEPRIDAEEPRIDAEEPRIDAEEPRIDAEDPRIDAEEPRIDAEDPRSNAEDPRSNAEDPRSNAEKPRGDVDEPLGDAEEPRSNSEVSPRKEVPDDPDELPIVCADKSVEQSLSSSSADVLIELNTNQSSCMAVASIIKMRKRRKKLTLKKGRKSRTSAAKKLSLSATPKVQAIDCDGDVKLPIIAVDGEQSASAKPSWNVSLVSTNGVDANTTEAKVELVTKNTVKDLVMLSREFSPNHKSLPFDGVTSRTSTPKRKASDHSEVDLAKTPKRWTPSFKVKQQPDLKESEIKISSCNGDDGNEETILISVNSRSSLSLLSGEDADASCISPTKGKRKESKASTSKLREHADSKTRRHYHRKKDLHKTTQVSITSFFSTNK